MIMMTIIIMKTIIMKTIIMITIIIIHAGGPSRPRHHGDDLHCRLCHRQVDTGPL